MNRSQFLRFGFGLLIAAGCVLAWPRPALAQESGLSERERITADRFLQVLKRRPRPGTALDRVYGFHVQNGSLENFIASLGEAKRDSDSPDGEESDTEFGNRVMILGLLQTQRGKQAAAAEAFTRAEQLLPDDYACSYFLGKSLLAVGQTEKAAAAMERSIERKPARNEAVPIFTELGRIYGRAGQTEKALAVWTKLEALFPGDVRVGGQIAATLAEEGNLEEALARYQRLAKSARKDDERIAFAVEAAEIQRRLGETEKATAALETILARLRPGSWLHSSVRNRIEESFLRSGDYDALAEYYKDKLADSPDDLTMQVRLGRVLVSARRLDEASETLADAARRAPDDFDVRLALIDVLVSKGDLAGAAEQFESLVESDPDNPDYLLRWGQLLLEDSERSLTDRRDSAAKVWRRLAEARSDDAVTLSQIADRMRGIDRKEEAIELYRKAIEVDPTSPQYREYLGEYLFRLNRKDEAITAWKSIAEGERRSSDSLVRLAEVFGTFGETERSLKAWREAAELDLTFAQELRFAQKLRDGKLFEEAIERLDAAERIAQTPDEREQLLKDRIETFQQAGTLTQKIAELESSESTAENLRTLAMMHSAAGQLAAAAAAIRSADEKSPNDADILLVAAEIAERQDRFVDAVETYRTLAKIDTRFQTNYLQRVADLQMRLGQADEAMKTCGLLIDANPASPESYQFLARLAFRSGRDDDAFTALRRAMNVAPRDNSPRQMLASAFADRYRTEEAIELYWQAMRYETEADGRIALVNRLAPLYERKNEIEQLIRRIDELAREDIDTRTIQLMIVAAYESVRDYGAARQTVDRLLADQPRDVGLLETMVRLSDAADDVVTAAEFQQRIVALADTPENRFRLVQYQLDAGLIDIKEALSQRITFGSDPSRLGMMVRSAVRRSDFETATAICEEAIKRDPGLWDVKLLLAQVLLQQASADTDTPLPDNQFPPNHQRAIDLASEIRAYDAPLDATPPTSRKQPGSQNSSKSVDTSPKRWMTSPYTLARTFRIGRYASSNYSNSGPRYGTVDPNSFGHARVLATTVKMMAISKRYPDQEAAQRIVELIDRELDLPPIDEIDDAALIWERRALDSFSRYMTINRASARKDDSIEKLNWRHAELDPENGSTYLRAMLVARARTAVIRKIKASATDTPEASEKTNDSEVNNELIFNDRQLRLVKELHETAERGLAENSTSWSIAADYRTILAAHFEASGETDKAEEYELQPPSDSAPLSDVLGAMSYYLTLHRVADAEALVDRLLPAVRRDKSGKNVSTNSLSGSAGRLMTSGEHGNEFVEKHRYKILDAVLAQAIKDMRKSNRGRSSLSNGTLSTYVRNSGNSYYSCQVKAPLSSALLDRQVVAELSSLMPPVETNGQPASVNLDEEVLAHLDKIPPDAPKYEHKTRAVLAAYAYWWEKQPEECYNRLVTLCKTYPDDVDLQIERARLASELSQPRIALETLDSFDPLDSKMLVRKEMAALALAVQLGDSERAKLAAERLFGMRVDTATQLALANQMRQLGMADKAAAVLRRLRGGRARDERTDLEIAQAFMTSGDKEAAAEVAYTVLRRVTSGRGSSSSSSSYRQQAVTILKNAGRLDPLIEQAKRRLAASPSSSRARTELAELYAAAGQKQKSDELFAEIAKEKPDDPRQLIQRAETLYRTRQYKDAADLYLTAFEKDPNQINRYCYQLTRAVSQGGDADEMYRRMAKIDPDAIPAHRVDDMIRIGRGKAYSDEKRKFIAHALKNSQVKRDFYRYIDDVPANEREKIPEVRETIIEAVCGDDAFSPTSTLWRVSSRSSGGKANGPLPSIMTMLKTDEEARERFLEAAKNACENEASKPAAEFLTALLETADDEKRAAAIDSIRKLVESDAAEFDRGDSKQNRLNGGLLWQSGQLIEKYSDLEDRAPLMVAIYKASASDPSIPITDMNYSVGARLVDALTKNGQKAEARKILLDAYAKTDHSSQNQYNPGYGDYQDIRAYDSIASKFSDIGLPIDALLIHKKLIASPDRYERAKRWGGNLSVDSSVKQVSTLEKSITTQTSAEFLSLIGDSLKSVKDSPAVNLLDYPLEQMFAASVDPAISIAIDSALQGPAGIEAIEDLQETLETQLQKRPEDWSVPATLLLLAIKSGSDDLSGYREQLFSRIPTADAMETAESKTLTKNRPLTALYTVANVAIHSDSDEARETGEELSAFLRALAKHSNDAGLRLAVATLGGTEDESLEELLDEIEQKSEGKARLVKSDLDDCLNVALLAAKIGRLKVSARALKLALQNGPTAGSILGRDVFALNTNQSNPQSQPTSLANIYATRMLGIVDALSDATGEKLGLREPKPLPNRSRGEISAEQWKALDQALQAIVLPENQPGAVYPYAKRIAMRTNYDNYSSSDVLDSASVSIAMARVAVLAANVDGLMEKLKTRYEKSIDRSAIAAVMVDVAVAAKDADVLVEALRHFETSLDSTLPQLDSAEGKQNQLTVINMQVQQDSNRKSDLVDLVVRTLAPVVGSEELKKLDTNGRSASILARLAKLIESDSYTASRHREILRRIREKVLVSAAKKGNQSLIESVLDGEVDSFKEQFLGMSSSDQKRYARNQKETMLRKLIADGMLPNSASFIRKMIAEESRADYDSPIALAVCREASKLSTAEKYTFLRRLALGVKDDDAILHWGGFVRYAEPPQIVASQAPELASVKAIPTCSPAIPIADTLLMLADLASATGKADELVTAFKARSKRPGDVADLSAAIIRVTARKNEKEDWSWLDPTIIAASKSLDTDKPVKTDKTLPYPDLMLYLAGRAAEKGYPTKHLRPLLQNLKLYSVRGQFVQVASVVGRLNASVGNGPAADAQSGSPLRHFHVVSIPNRGKPITRSLGPLYKIDEEGWLCATGGDGVSLLMLKYPIEGSFQISFRTADGSFGEADLSYGGVNFPTNGWTQKAKLIALGRTGVSEFPVPSLGRAKANHEMLEVTSDGVAASCNEEVYANDLRSKSSPWAAITHAPHRTIRIHQISIDGDVSIPREVDLIDPTLRGWGSFSYSVGLPDPMLPLHEGNQNAGKIRTQRTARKKAIADEDLTNAWFVKNGELIFDDDSGESVHDPGSHLRYVRPLLDGESVVMTFWWKENNTEVHPTIGQTLVRLGKNGHSHELIKVAGDLATATLQPISAYEAVEYEAALAAEVAAQAGGTKNVPKNDAWNTLRMKRAGNQIELTLNDKPLTTIVAPESASPGFVRDEDMNVKFRSIKLSGDWPEALPKDLLEKKQ